MSVSANSYIFGPKKDEVTGERRKLNNQELNDLYSSHNIVRNVVMYYGQRHNMH